MTVYVPGRVIVLGVIGSQQLLTTNPVVDPSAGGGVAAPINSVYFGTLVYLKTGAGNTAWVPLALGSAAAGRFAPPEQWAQQDVVASQTNVALSCAVSTNFDTIKMIRAGSVVGLATRLTEVCTAGTLTVTITKNAVAGTLSVVTTNASNTTGGQSTQAIGIDTYVAGDLIGVQLTTTAGWLPVTDDLEAWLELEES